MTRLTRLREMLPNVTPGPYIGKGPNVMLPEGGHLCWTRATSDARYIAMLDPEFVRAMLDALDAADDAMSDGADLREFKAYRAARAQLEQEPPC